MAAPSPLAQSLHVLFEGGHPRHRSRFAPHPVNCTLERRRLAVAALQFEAAQASARSRTASRILAEMLQSGALALAVITREPPSGASRLQFTGWVANRLDAPDDRLRTERGRL